MIATTKLVSRRSVRYPPTNSPSPRKDFIQPKQLTVAASSTSSYLDQSHEDEYSHPINEALKSVEDDMSYGPKKHSSSVIRGSIVRAASHLNEIYNTELPYQNKVRIFYMGPGMQISVAVLIFSNFLLSAIATTQGPAHEQSDVFVVFDYIFTVLFAIELGMNMYAHWLWDFWMSNWNIFDFTIVLISILSNVLNDVPGITVLRLFRAFRVFRLFKRVESLRKIIEGVIKSLPGVFNAFGILLLLMGIWAIMGVELFYEHRRFDNFLKAMLLMFQVLTLDGWYDPLKELATGEYDDGEEGFEEYGYFFPVIYFVSYIFIITIVMINVVIAVLIENFLSRDQKEEDEVSSISESSRPEFGVSIDPPPKLKYARTASDSFDSKSTTPMVSIDSDPSIPNLHYKSSPDLFKDSPLSEPRRKLGQIKELLDQLELESKNAQLTMQQLLDVESRIMIMVQTNKSVKRNFLK